MIDYLAAKMEFDKFVGNYDKSNGTINLKIVHTYGVVENSIYIAKELGLSKEDIELAKLIALLHDIGRFEQTKKFGNLIDHETIDHAKYGVYVLFKNKLIKNFVQTNKYDEIIEKAILNHNKYKIDENLSEKQLLHAKIIRDADKLDNFRVKATEKFENIANVLSRDKMENDYVSNKVFDEFMKKRTIVTNERETVLDMWVSYIAFIFDFNFSVGLKYIKEKNYINILIDRLNYKINETKERMNLIRECAINYIEDELNKR